MQVCCIPACALKHDRRGFERKSWQLAALCTTCTDAANAKYKATACQLVKLLAIGITAVHSTPRMGLSDQGQHAWC